VTKAPKISDLSHRVALCTMSDVVESKGTMSLSRSAVARVWAKIRGTPAGWSFISQQGYAILNPQDKPTHIVTIRAGTAVDVQSAAWVYEEFLKSMPRWYKVLGFSETDGWINLTCRLVEKSDDVSPPRGDLSPQMAKVML
jgi:head-tail adaptor